MDVRYLVQAVSLTTQRCVYDVLDTEDGAIVCAHVDFENAERISLALNILNSMSFNEVHRRLAA